MFYLLVTYKMKDTEECQKLLEHYMQDPDIFVLTAVNWHAWKTTVLDAVLKLLRRSRMRSNEEYIATAHTVQELINILKDKVPADADVDVGNMSTTEVWYDECLNNVKLK